MVISGVISGVTVLITHITELITPLIITHEPPSISLQIHYMQQGSSLAMHRVQLICGRLERT